MKSLFNLLDEIIQEAKQEQRWYETNDRRVIIEKFQKNSSKIWIENICVDDAIYFLKNDSEDNLHRLNGEPAVISPRLRAWYKNGELHRTGDKPALTRLPMNVTYKFPIEKYAINGRIHRDFDKPAITWQGECKAQAWYQNGFLHRDNNKPAFVAGNFRYYFTNGSRNKTEIFWRNNFVNWIINYPVYMILCFFIILLFFVFC